MKRDARRCCVPYTLSLLGIGRSVRPVRFGALLKSQRLPVP